LKRGQASLEAALALDPSNDRARESLGEALFERARLAELEFRNADLSHLVEQMQRFDADGHLSLLARWTRPGTVELRTAPPGAQLVLERFDLADDGNQLLPVRVGVPFAAPSGERRLPPGSYRVTATKAGFAEAKFPFVVRRGEPAQFEIRLLPADQVPADFVYVPEGRFLYGDANEDWRLGFLNAAPIHERVAPAFLIKAHETTFGDWLEFLRDLPADERQLRIPSSVAVQGSVVVRRSADASYSLELSISGPRMEAREGSPIVYPTRRRRTSQDWLRMPVLGISPRDMQAYFSWLSRTGKVPGARFCSELEWERAARGADGRAYPASQERVTGDDANIDLTYGRVRGSYGPDEVGAHPRSRSPFGIEDLTGNAWEAVAAEGGESLVRGGGYYHSLTSARVTNREFLDRESRSYILGVRVCAATK
jgi:formylglycine-generating enzyme required for sulfatase activity